MAEHHVKPSSHQTKEKPPNLSNLETTQAKPIFGKLCSTEAGSDMSQTRERRSSQELKMEVMMASSENHHNRQQQGESYQVKDEPSGSQPAGGAEQAAHRGRITGSSTSNESVQVSAREATRYKWRTIGQQLRSISDQFELRRHQLQSQSNHPVIMRRPLACGPSNGASWTEWSKLLLLICVALGRQAARCWRL